MWRNRNACFPLTLERRSVNVLTCEFTHRIREAGTLYRVSWGEKEGGDEEPDRPGRPVQREQRSKLENNPPDRYTTHRAGKRGTPPANTRPNLSDQRERQPRPQVENNSTRTRPARQATHNPSPPPQERTAPHRQPPTNRRHRPTGGRPEPGSTAHQAGGAGVKEGSKGSGPRTPCHPPTEDRDPPAKHRHPPDTPTSDPNPSRKPDTRTRTPTILLPPHHPRPTRYPAHMPWSTSDRRQRLPTNWNKTRKQVLAKAKYKCQGLDPVATPPPTSRAAVGGHRRWHHPACDMHATDVDHIVAGDNHELSNLQALSHACHTAKTAHENAVAKARMRATATRERPPHPCARATQTNKKEKQNKTKAKTNESKTRVETTRRETWS